MEKIKKDEEVVIKTAKQLFGKVVSFRDDGEEGVIYKVLIPERTMYFRREDLEPWPKPSTEPVRWSKEWNRKLEQWTELGQECLANPEDKELATQFAALGEKLGFFRAIE